MSTLAPDIPGLELFEELGRGARNTVFRGRRRGRVVAVKLPRVGDLEADYRREAALQARVPGAGLPEVYEVGCHNGTPFLITELIEGQPLAARLSRGPLSEPETLHLAQQLAHTLLAIHRTGLVHRDLKPANILLTPNGQCRLIDFGLAIRSHIGDSVDVTGTFLYSAPEQTGMLKRPLDGRADLYALGVVLYECLAGHPPFRAQDPAELIRLHAVATPPPLEPGPLTQAIQKLLKKDPDDRFPSAAAFLQELGLPEVAVKVPTPVARSEEKHALAACWNSVTQGGGQIVTITGEGGSGKSLLASAFAVSTGSLVLQARCDPTGQPFGVVDQLLAQLPERLPPQQHYVQSLAELFVRWGKQQPAVLLIDDLQWIDASSLQVLRRLAGRIAETRLLILITSREEAFPSNHVLRLSPLGSPDVHALLANLLGGEPQTELVDQVLLASGGLPFAAAEIAETALDAGLFVPHWGQWRAIHDGLTQLDLPRDVMAAVLRRLDHLTPDQRELLQGAAVLGSRFSAETLARMLPECELFPVLAEGVRLHLLEPHDHNQYRFVHDRIREALLSGIADARELHLKAAKALDPDQVFARAEHLWQAHSGGADGAHSGGADGAHSGGADGAHSGGADGAHSGGADGAQCPQADEANAAAGHLALQQHANEEAHAYFSRCGPCDDPTFCRAFGDAAYRVGRFADALEHFTRALQSSTDPVDRAHLRHRMSLVYMVEIDTSQAWPCIVAALEELGRPVHRSLPHALLSLGRSVTHPVEMLLLVAGAHMSALDGRVPEFLQMVARGIAAGRRLGPSPELASFYNYASVFLGVLQLRGPSQRCHAAAAHVASVLNDPAVDAQTELYAALRTRVLGQESLAAQLQERCLTHKQAWLSTLDSLLGILDLTHNLHFRGELARAMVWAETGARRVRDDHYPVVVTCSLSATYAAVARHADAPRRPAQETSPSRIRRCAFLVSGLHAQLESNELGSEAERLIQEFHDTGLSPLTAPFQTRSFYILEAHVRHRQALRDRARLPEFQVALRRLWTTSFLTLYRTHYHLLHSAYLRLQGKHAKADSWLVSAERLANETDNSWVRLEVLVQRARRLRQQELPCEREARLAAHLASDLGWVSQQSLIEREFQLASRSSSLGSRDSAAQSALLVRLQRNVEALLQVTLASALALDSSKLSQLALRELLRILGAERAFLFLGDDLRWEIGLDATGAVLTEPRDYATTVVRQAAATRRALLLSGTEDGQLLGSESVVAHNLRSILAAPLTVGQRVLGVVYLDSRLARGVFSQDDVQLLRALANQIAVTLETARAARLEVQVHAEREQRLLAEQLGEMVGSMLSHLDASQILEKLLDGLHQVIPFDSASTLIWREGHAEPGPARGELTNIPPWQEVVEGTRPIQMADCLSAALRAFGGPLGCVHLQREGGFKARDLEVLHTFVGYAAMALENARLFSDVQRLATTDELTRLSNRRHFFRQSEEEFRRADRLGHELTVLMFDVDHFKKFNDNYGHATGDAVLVTTASRCRDALRSIDILGRYGGEEFAVVLVGTGQEPGLSTAERLRAAMADEPFQDNLKVTISIGVATRNAGETIEQVLERADGALYAAKAAGRNCVQLAQ